MKEIIKRRYTESGIYSAQEGYFINTGIWADGRLAYSRCDKDGNIIEEGEYYQLRCITNKGNKLVMFHV